MPRRAALAVASLIAVAGCSSDSDATPKAEAVTVFAASSLTDVFADLGTAFERRNRGIELSFVFGSSSDLVTQLEQGARAEVLASADEVSMKRALDANVVAGDPHVFVRNELEIIVPAENPGGVTELADLANEDLVLTICNRECPAGRYALEVFENAGMSVVPDSLEAEVKGVVTRVVLGEADVGIAYVTDTRAAAGEIVGIPIPDDDAVVASYQIGALSGSSDAAGRLIDFVLSDEGRRILRRYGFLPP
jgi:molybdate transport system substrate-binding protein